MLILPGPVGRLNVAKVLSRNSRQRPKNVNFSKHISHYRKRKDSTSRQPPTAPPDLPNQVSTKWKFRRVGVAGSQRDSIVMNGKCPIVPPYNRLFQSALDRLPTK